MKLCGDETLDTVLIGENSLKAVGNPSLDTFKLRDSHGPQVLAIVAVLILATPNTGLLLLALSHNGDVNEHAVGHVDPAGVNYVLPVTTVNLDVMRVDVEEVAVLDDGAVGCGGVVGVLGAVEVLAYPLEGVVGDLDVEIVVPRHNLAVPPPAEEGSVGEPRLDAILVHDGQVALDEVLEDEAVLAVGDLVLEVAAVIVTQFQSASGFGEVFWCLLVCPLRQG